MKIEVGVAVLTMLTASMLQSQSSPDTLAKSSSTVLRIGVAAGAASTGVGGQNSTDAGIVLTGLVGFPISGRSDLALDLAIQPFEAQNPVRDEAYTTVYALAGLELGLDARHRAFVRPELGAAFRSWSGSDVFTASETGVALGVALGYGIPVGRTLGLVFEGAVRVSGADELSTVLWTAGVSFVPMGARH